MLRKEEATEVVKEVLSRSPFSKTEVSVQETGLLSCRYGDNQLTQSVRKEKISLSVRAIDGAKQARVDLDKLGSYDQAFEKLRALLAVLPVEKIKPELHSCGDQYSVPERERHEDVTPEMAADAIGQATSLASRRGLSTSGIYSNETQTFAFGNSEGLLLSDEVSDSEFSCTMDGKNGSGKGFSYQPQASRLDIKASVERAAEKCLAASDPVTIDPGEYDVVLEPNAFVDLLVFFGWIGLSAKAYVEKRTFCQGRLGEILFNENVTLLDDPCHSEIQGLYFDGQGAAKRKTTFVEKGRLVQLASDDKTARVMGTVTTGHGLPEPTTQDPIPWNIGMEWAGPTMKASEQVASIKRGILVSQFHYSNVVDLMTPSLTGMTRNGTFLIENGKVTKPIRNMRYTQSLVEVFNRIEAVSDERERVAAFFGGASLAPTVLVRGFHFSSGTGF